MISGGGHTCYGDEDADGVGGLYGVGVVFLNIMTLGLRLCLSRGGWSGRTLVAWRAYLFRWVAFRDGSLLSSVSVSEVKI